MRRPYSADKFYNANARDRLFVNPLKPVKKMTYLSYPSLDLFLYHLRNPLGEGEEKVKSNYDIFRANLPADIQPALENEPAPENPDYAKLLELATGKKTHPIKTEVSGYPVGGYYYPVRLGDVYGLLVDCYVNDKITPQTVNWFAQLKKQAAGTTGDLGKTWMISGWVPKDSEAEPTTIASEAYQALTGREWKHVKMGKFLGADVFEVGTSPDLWQSLGDTDPFNCPVLIVLYPDLATMDKIVKFYDDWLRLFCYRQKILWAYREARQHAEFLRGKLSSFNEAIASINESKTDLQKMQAILENNLASFANYVIRLSQLEILSQAIATNLHNYQLYLNQIAEKSQKVGETNLRFLEEFSKIAKGQYQPQLEKDRASFKPGVAVLENLSNTVRGLVEIQQAEIQVRLISRDRSLQEAVAIAGVGVGGASAAASAISPFIDTIAHPPASEQTTPPPTYISAWVNFGAAFSISIVIGALLSAFTWLVVRLAWPHRPKSIR